MGHKTIWTAVHDAVITFNNGTSRRLLVLNEMGLKSGFDIEKALRRIDNERIFHSQRAAQSSTKEARTKRRNAKKQKESACEEADDYDPGMY